MMQSFFQILCAGFGTLGFALLFHVRPKHIPFACLGGALSWAVELLVRQGTGGGIFLPALIAAAVTCIWAETMARYRKAPANTFLIPGIIPLLPGGSLYYCLQGVVSQNKEIFVAKGMETILVTLGIASGIVLASELVKVVIDFERWRKRRKI